MGKLRYNSPTYSYELCFVNWTYWNFLESLQHVGHNDVNTECTIACNKYFCYRVFYRCRQAVEVVIHCDTNAHNRLCKRTPFFSVTKIFRFFFGTSSSGEVHQRPRRGYRLKNIASPATMPAPTAVYRSAWPRTSAKCSCCPSWSRFRLKNSIKPSCTLLNIHGNRMNRWKMSHICRIWYISTIHKGERNGKNIIKIDIMGNAAGRNMRSFKDRGLAHYTGVMLKDRWRDDACQSGSIQSRPINKSQVEYFRYASDNEIITKRCNIK